MSELSESDHSHDSDHSNASNDVAETSGCTQPMQAVQLRHETTHENGKNTHEDSAAPKESTEGDKLMYCFICNGHRPVTGKNPEPFPYLLIDKDLGKITVRQPVELTKMGNSTTRGFKSFAPAYVILSYAIAEECRKGQSSEKHTWPPQRHLLPKYVNILNHLLPAKSQLVCWYCADQLLHCS